MNESNIDINAPEIKKQSKWAAFFSEVFKFFMIIIFVVIPFRIFVAQPFIVEGASMDPTFENGQYLIVDQLTYHFSTPERGSILIFKYPEDHRQFFIKRVIALPGETVDIKKGIVKITNSENPDGFIFNQSFLTFTKDDNTSITLGSDQYFVMGDNRPASSDSRVWGAVSEDEIIGRPLLRLLPLSKINIFPGDFSK